MLPFAHVFIGGNIIIKNHSFTNITQNIGQNQNIDTLSVKNGK